MSLKKLELGTLACLCLALASCTGTNTSATNGTKANAQLKWIKADNFSEITIEQALAGGDVVEVNDLTASSTPEGVDLSFPIEAFVKGTPPANTGSPVSLHLPRSSIANQKVNVDTVAQVSMERIELTGGSKITVRQTGTGGGAQLSGKVVALVTGSVGTSPVSALLVPAESTFSSADEARHAARGEDAIVKTTLVKERKQTPGFLVIKQGGAFMRR